jgi:hypothetical protein
MTINCDICERAVDEGEEFVEMKPPLVSERCTICIGCLERLFNEAVASRRQQ